MKCARELAIDCREVTLSRYDLLRADEVFLSGTGARVVPVATLDGETLGSDDERPLTLRIIDALNSYSQVDGVPF